MRSTAFVLLYFLATLTLRSEVATGVSLEWLADESASIGIYRVTEARQQSEPDREAFQKYTGRTDLGFRLSFQLDDALKGKAPETTISGYLARPSKGAPPPAVAIGDRFLIFFTGITDSVRVVHLINLSNPQFATTHSAAINYKVEVLTDKAEILSTVRNRLRSHPAGASTTRQGKLFADWVEVFDGPAYKILYERSSCYLIVPDDLKPVPPNK